MQNQNYAAFSPGVSDAATIRGSLITSAWVPHEVRCCRCAATASMDNMDCVGDDEIAVDYNCPDCGWHLTQHFHDEVIDRDRHPLLRE